MLRCRSAKIEKRLTLIMHSPLSQSLEGGGEYTIEGDSSWSQSLNQVSKVIEFVAYGSGEQFDTLLLIF